MKYYSILKKEKDDEFDDGDSGTFGFMTAPRTFTDEKFDDYVNGVKQKIRETSDMTQKEKMDIENHLMTLENLAYDRKETKDGKVSPKFKEVMFEIERLLQREFDSSMQDDFRAIHASASQPTSDWWDTIKAKKKKKKGYKAPPGVYTKPRLRERIHATLLNESTHGTGKGKWSGWKSVELNRRYKEAGGGYVN